MSPRLSLFLITTFGLGHLRPAPGTWGSLPTVLLAGVLILAGVPLGGTLAVMAGVAIIFSLICVLAGDEAEAYYRRPDPSHVVADETAGQAVTFLFLTHHAIATPGRAMITLALGFVLFRLFDIFKPPPANQLQDAPAGWGILLDDLAAAVYAGLVLLLITRFAMR